MGHEGAAAVLMLLAVEMKTAGQREPSAVTVASTANPLFALRFMRLTPDKRNPQMIAVAFPRYHRIEANGPSGAVLLSRQ